MQTELNTQSGMTIKTLVPFLALTFGVTWSIAALLILFTDQIVAIFGEISISNPLYILAVYAPSLAVCSWYGARMELKVWVVSSAA